MVLTYGKRSYSVYNIIVTPRQYARVKNQPICEANLVTHIGLDCTNKSP